MRLIDADKIVYSWQIDADGEEHDGVTLQSIIKKMPTIEKPYAENTGRWIECDHEKWDVGVHGLRCSECYGGYHLNIDRTIYYWNYCPNCGARMVGDLDEGS